MARLSKQSIYRILDANLNRASEGMRVCEEITRFILNDRGLTAQFKNMRHSIFKVFIALERAELIKKRESREDAGRNLMRGEFNRGNYQDIFFANMQRAKESIRVLEEFFKLIDKNAAIKFKRLRYHAYEIEKKVTLKFSALSNIRQGFLPSRQRHRSAA